MEILSKIKELLDIEKRNDIFNLTTKERAEFQAEVIERIEEYHSAVEELEKYEEAEAQGLLLRLPAPLDGVESFSFDGKETWVKLPCPLRTTIYKIDGVIWKGYEWKYPCYDKAYAKETVFTLEMLPFVGKTVFLTKEEAEQALKQMGE